MAGDLSKLPFAVGPSRASRQVIRQYLWVSLGVMRPRGNLALRTAGDPVRMLARGNAYIHTRMWLGSAHVGDMPLLTVHQFA